MDINPSQNPRRLPPLAALEARKWPGTSPSTAFPSRPRLTPKGPTTLSPTISENHPRNRPTMGRSVLSLNPVRGRVRVGLVAFLELSPASPTFHLVFPFPIPRSLTSPTEIIAPTRTGRRPHIRLRTTPLPLLSGLYHSNSSFYTIPHHLYPSGILHPGITAQIRPVPCCAVTAAST